MINDDIDQLDEYGLSAHREFVALRGSPNQLAPLFRFLHSWTVRGVFDRLAVHATDPEAGLERKAKARQAATQILFLISSEACPA